MYLSMWKHERVFLILLDHTGVLVFQIIATSNAIEEYQQCSCCLLIISCTSTCSFRILWVKFLSPLIQREKPCFSICEWAKRMNQYFVSLMAETE